MFGFLKRRPSDMWLFVGLGNPGDKYSKNRHNIGFMAIDHMVDHWSMPPFRSKFEGQMSEGRVGSEKVVFLKPSTYMNKSGQSVGKAAKFFKVDPDRIVIFHDELDLAPAKLRIKKGGGNAGHNGLKSIQAYLGTPDFWRVRMGIGHPGDKNKVHSYVLKDFASSEKNWVEDLVSGCSTNCDLLLQGDFDGYMSKVASNVRPVTAKENKNK